ncbi:flagellar export chaperone FliS [Desulfallas sp. Bu1-1]|uniref:flagellar export chaperone FliS n=1 Tax=Desulfallas sp. Bu1-1 TaxID=2787620 RepID=UPI00189D01E2|nr:flagellar export chaperone FliS [Desulfallas sp. Bu1-1]MBF7081970.1 flagellar export chaperone FliS [Desulfallas sp. Bu1-1]
MALPNPYQKYRQNSVTTATPEELTLMLYNGGVRFIRQGIKHIEDKNIEKAHEALVRAQEIYMHLANTLNHEIELSAGLNSLYDFILRQLAQANIKKDVSILSGVLELAEELRDTWKEAMQKARGQVAEG